MGETRTLVERARNWPAGMPPTTHILADMADTIERQEREIERLRADKEEWKSKAALWSAYASLAEAKELAHPEPSDPDEGGEPS